MSVSVCTGTSGGVCGCGRVCGRSVYTYVSVDVSPHVYIFVCVCVYVLQGWVCVCMGVLCVPGCCWGGVCYEGCQCVSMWEVCEAPAHVSLCVSSVHSCVYEVSVWTWGGPVCLYICTCMRLCVSGRVCVRSRECVSSYVYASVYLCVFGGVMHTYLHICLCVCICVCVCIVRVCTLSTSPGSAHVHSGPASELSLSQQQLIRSSLHIWRQELSLPHFTADKSANW